MKNMKKMTSLLLLAAMLLSMVACGGKTAEPTEAVAESGSTAIYTVTVETAGGMAMSGLDVYVYADNTLADLKKFGQTDENGQVSFELAESDSYTVTLSGVPKGYELADSYAFSGKTARISLTSALIADESLSGATLGLGDVMYDFSVITPAGENVKLSEMLKEKDMVLLNFWYTTCTYCVAEFPFMEEAYQQYSEDVGIVAVNPFEEDAAISAFQAQMGLTFPMAKCQPAWSATFNVSGYPTSIVVDRYGVICLIEAGGITSLRPFTSMFDHFSGDDYRQQLFTSLDELVTDIKPTYTMPSHEEITAAINSGEIEVTYRGEEGEAAEMTWPFIIGEKNGETCIYASNQEIDGSYAILYADVTLKAGQALGFDFLRSTETGSDIMYVIVNGDDVNAVNGYFAEERWESLYPVVAKEDGVYEVALCYIKDDSTNVGDDTVYIKNMRVVDAADIDTETYLPCYAATSIDGFEYDYVDVVLNEEDGYYHVGDKNGPLLLADLYGHTEFTEEQNIWDIVYEGPAQELYDEMVNYFNYASNSMLEGVCTVNAELAELLKQVTAIAGFDGTENEWLKICKYYEVYGTDKQLTDPIEGLAPFCALTAKEGKNVPTNFFYYERIIMPRGKLAEFVPTKSGVYRITSRNDSQDGVEGWIFSENHEELYTYWHNERMYKDDNNVSMLYYMEAGEKYYIDIAFWDTYGTGYIYYDIEYVGATLELFRLASPGYFTYDTNATGDAMYYTIAGGIDVVLGEDGIYYELREDGTKGSKLYCDFIGVTSLFSNPIATVDGNGKIVDAADPTAVAKGMIDLGGFDFSKTEEDMYILAFLEKRNFDVEATRDHLKAMWGADFESYAELYQIEDVFAGKYHGKGEDMTEAMRGFLDDVITSGSQERLGCVVVTKELADILQLLMDNYTFEGVDHSWTKLCYFYEYLGPKK